MTDCSSGGSFSSGSGSGCGSGFFSACFGWGCSGAAAFGGSSVFLPGSTMRRIAYTIADTTAQERIPRKVFSLPAYSSHTIPMA